MPAGSTDRDTVGRSTPAKGVLPTPDGATILWCTVCADHRGHWCACGNVMSLLHEVWQNQAQTWLVGDYLIMPDHLHFFCTPAMNQHVEIERWTAFWKDRFSKQFHHRDCRWQAGIFHHRLRSEREYLDKVIYMRNNPVRKGLARDPDEWPWQGRVHPIHW